MKNMLTLIVLLSSWLTVYSQESYTEAELKQKCDSIVEEANTLYRYETAAWNFTDMIFAKPGLIETIQNILTTTRAILLNVLLLISSLIVSMRQLFLMNQLHVRK